MPYLNDAPILFIFQNRKYNANLSYLQWINYYRENTLLFHFLGGRIDDYLDNPKNIVVITVYKLKQSQYS